MYFFAEYLVFSVHCKISACRLAFLSSSLSLSALNFAVYIASFGIQGMLIFLFTQCLLWSIAIYSFCFLRLSSAYVGFNELLANSFFYNFF
jgi:hypothetical protein